MTHLDGPWSQSDCEVEEPPAKITKQTIIGLHRKERNFVVLVLRAVHRARGLPYVFGLLICSRFRAKKKQHGRRCGRRVDARQRGRHQLALGGEVPPHGPRPAHQPPRHYHHQCAASTSSGRHRLSHPCFLAAVQRFIKEDRLPHLLFYGPPGTGKTSTIKACAQEMYGAHIKSMVLEVGFVFPPDRCWPARPLE